MWYYVYILRLNDVKHFVGRTSSLKEKFARHKKGYVPATQPYLPMKLVWCSSISHKYGAYEFERYRKSGSSRACLKTFAVSL